MQPVLCRTTIDNEDIMNIDKIDKYEREFATGSLADRLAHWWQEGKVEVPGEPLSLSDSGSENCNCFGQILRIFCILFILRPLGPFINFRTHSMGTSTKDDDRAKILPGVEGALLSI